ncbi:MAG TPA: DUF3108 domain-containing protein [Candidatus Manganitrophaceae bacterium]|nr:DUF3108 domain-containing protein [Candidatus Manganitrophaceae bacterium]
MRRYDILLLFSFVLMASPIEAMAPVSIPPVSHTGAVFELGERLVYDITYLGAKGGKAVLEVLEKTRMKGRDVYRIVSTAQSNDFVSLFYPVDDRIESFMDVEGLYSHHIIIKQQEGKRKREKIIDFDQVRHRAIQIKQDKRNVFEIPPKVQDSLSSLYFFRTTPPVEVGESTYIDVHESEKNWQLEIRSLAKEEVTTPVGKFNTVKVQAKVRYEGLFMEKGDVFIWFTDDYKRIPVMMTSKIKIGTITATLSSRREGNLARQGELSAVLMD